MIDSALLIEVLNSTLAHRNVLYAQLSEANAYTEDEDHAFQEKTKRIEELKTQIENAQTTNSCISEKLSLDEAIEYARSNSINDSIYSQIYLQFAKWLEELKNLKEKYLYLAADFDNYKKRSIAREAQYSYTTTKNIIYDFLRIYDDLERTVKAFKYNMQIEDDELKSGIELMLKNFEKLLAAEGCQKIDCKLGDKFDVNTMEAVATREIQNDEDYAVDDVVEIFYSGWKMKGPVEEMIIRPVKVVVGRQKSNEEFSVQQ